MSARLLLVPRRLANDDVEQAVAWYRDEAGIGTANAFINALEAAYARIASAPDNGSPRYGYELGLPGLRTRGLKRFPYIVCYVRQPTYVDIWRVLHGKRDVPAALMLD
ncbi:type II toxin-antitoxin system RelE/ParE family toxin [Sandaracinobacteroides saxicola]|uniref:Type II toxin-antitoxin system RelE/ParE family toxin n=1 Tax=Sandaracinobacteroides saxicola TaxID=2759707 RepID=A0A7G5IIY5_9SPHN|nr:type II toxin-antitoxin system RelE/ParE family toxin [Sandaracinobacteroides saxicola]QMW23327.1 type II toxin-antitoxin system RelE/ParE family toxin [Sandaracinobacteroides saxicola]